jgi:hypothetical protein
MKGACVCPHMLSALAPGIALQSRGGNRIWNSAHALVANLLVHALDAIEIESHFVQHWPRKRTCTSPGHTSNISINAAQHVKGITKSHCGHQLGAHHSTPCGCGTSGFEGAALCFTWARTLDLFRCAPSGATPSPWAPLQRPRLFSYVNANDRVGAR